MRFEAGTYDNSAFHSEICLFEQPYLHLLSTLQKSEDEILQKSTQPMSSLRQSDNVRASVYECMKGCTTHDGLCHDSLDFRRHGGCFACFLRGLLCFCELCKCKERCPDEAFNTQQSDHEDVQPEMCNNGIPRSA